MDWNQISNYAARHTHKKLGLGEARASGWSARDSRGRGVQTPVQSARPGPLAGSERLVCAPGRRAAPLRGGGSFQFCVWDRGCALAPEGQPEEGCRGHRPGRTFRPCGPAAPAALLSAAGCAHRRRPSPFCPSPPPWEKVPPPATGLAHRARGFRKEGPGRAGWAPGRGTLTPTSSCAHTQNHAHTHTDSCLDTPPAVAPSTAPFPVLAAPRPTLRPFLSCQGREGREENRSQISGGLAGPGAARKATRFPSLVPGAPNKRAARPPPARRAWFPPPEPRLETRKPAEKKRPEQRNRDTNTQKDRERQRERGIERVERKKRERDAEKNEELAWEGGVL